MAHLPPHRFPQQPYPGAAPNANPFPAPARYGGGYAHPGAGMAMLPQAPKAGHTKWLVLGWLAALMLVSCEALGVGMCVAPTHPEDVASGITVGVFGLVLWGIPAALMLTVGYRALRRYKRFRTLIALAASSVRLPMQTLATELKLTAADAREMLMEAIAAGSVRGRMDLEEGVFISGNADASVQHAARQCPRCGAQSQVVVAPGQPAVCPHCRAAL